MQRIETRPRRCQVVVYNNVVQLAGQLADEAVRRSVAGQTTQILSSAEIVVTAARD